MFLDLVCLHRAGMWGLLFSSVNCLGTWYLRRYHQSLGSLASSPARSRLRLKPEGCGYSTAPVAAQLTIKIKGWRIGRAFASLVGQTQCLLAVTNRNI